MTVTISGSDVSRLYEAEAETGLAVADSTAPAGMALARMDGPRYVARQPILDAQGKLHGYELLFRAGPTQAFSGDGNHATRTMLDNTIIFGLDRLSGGMPVFINCTQESLLDRLVMVMPPSHTVLELLETLEPTDALYAACCALKAHGFRLALDDFVWKPEWQRFIDLADYVKVDLSTTTPEERVTLIDRLGEKKIRLVAERVETQTELAMAEAEGFTLFQGYYFCRPVLMENTPIPANRLVYLELLQAVHQVPLDTAKVSALVKRDAALTHRLLQVVNSPLCGVRKEVRSIHGALVMIGDEMFRRIATLAIAGELRGKQPSELLRMAYVRARFCELTAPVMRQDATEQYLLGIFSLLPALLRIPMKQIDAALPLRREIRDALMGESNAERTALDWLLGYEEAQWEVCDQIARSAQLPESLLPHLYESAVAWAAANLDFAG